MFGKVREKKEIQTDSEMKNKNKKKQIFLINRFSTLVFGAFAVVRAQYNHHQYSSYYNQQHHQNQPGMSESNSFTLYICK